MVLNISQTSEEVMGSFDFGVLEGVVVLAASKNELAYHRDRMELEEEEDSDEIDSEDEENDDEDEEGFARSKKSKIYCESAPPVKRQKTDIIIAQRCMFSGAAERRVKVKSS